MHRFFIEGRHHVGEVVALTGADAHKIVNVLRKRSGDRIEVFDSAAQRFLAQLHVDRSVVNAILQEQLQTGLDSLPKVTIAQGIPKGQKMDFAIEKLVELGVSTIVPLVSERTITSKVSAAKLARWRRLAIAASQQCGRSDVPPVSDPIQLDALISRFREYDCVLLPWELADRETLRDRLADVLRDARTVLVIIGAEGGFSHDEAQTVQLAGAQIISLGPRILRTETAGLVAMAIIGYICR